MVGCKNKIYSKYIILLDYWQISLFLILQYYVVRLCTILVVCSANFRYFSFRYKILDIFCVGNDVLSHIVSLIGYVNIKWDIYLNFKYCTTNVLRIRKPEITASKIKLVILILEYVETGYCIIHHLYMYIGELYTRTLCQNALYGGIYNDNIKQYLIYKENCIFGVVCPSFKVL